VRAAALGDLGDLHILDIADVLVAELEAGGQGEAPGGRDLGRDRGDLLEALEGDLLVAAVLAAQLERDVVIEEERVAQPPLRLLPLEVDQSVQAPLDPEPEEVAVEGAERRSGRARRC
jgi:hypothetical protein